MKTTQAIKLKTGGTLPKGLPVTFIEDRPTICLVHSPTGHESYKVRIVSAFKPPTAPTLARWGRDGGCKTPTGQWTEQDGHGEDGSPSWMLALNMI